MIRSPWKRQGTALLVGETVAAVAVTERIAAKVVEAMNAEAKVAMREIPHEVWQPAAEESLDEIAGASVAPIGRLVPRDLPGALEQDGGKDACPAPGPATTQPGDGSPVNGNVAQPSRGHYLTGVSAGTGVENDPPSVIYATANGMWLRREYPHLDAMPYYPRADHDVMHQRCVEAEARIVGLEASHAEAWERYQRVTASAEVALAALRKVVETYDRWGHAIVLGDAIEAARKSAGVLP